MRKAIVLAGLLFAWLASVASAGTIPEYRVIAGAYIPTGSQTDFLKSSALLGMQGGVEVNDMLHFVATFGYATPRPKAPLSFTSDIHIYQYDVGAELFHIYSASKENDHWTLRPFAGAGLGGRTYDYLHSDVKSQTDVAGYGSLGTEFQHQNIALRLEVRDYLTRFNGFQGELATKTQNNLVVGGGFSFHF